MGYTAFTKQLVKKIIDQYSVKEVIDLGSCNDYEVGGLKPPFISEWYDSMGLIYSCIDLAGDNNAFQMDLANPPADIGILGKFDLVVDAGTSEHVVKMGGYESVSFHDDHIHSIYPTSVLNIENGYYNCWTVKNNLCRKGGIIISINPTTGNWPGHGYTYIDSNFYTSLEKISGLHILSCENNPASGNDIDGWETVCVMKKQEDQFPDFKTFKKLPMYRS